MRKGTIKNSLLAFMAVILAGCSAQPGDPGIYPDYRDVTVPCNIAPLNFHYTGVRYARTTFSAGDKSFSIRGGTVRISPERWRSLLLAAKNGIIEVSSSAMDGWRIYVSADSVDRYLTYRLIEPGYEVWDRVEIRERDLSGFSERVLSSHENTDNSCMNCHIHKGNRSMFYLRGAKGGAVLNDGGTIRKLNLRNEDMISGTVYGDLHPDGRWGVFSTNIIIPGFHTLGSRRLEVYDTASDLTVADFEDNRMLNTAEFADAGKLETFPCFSADGRSVFFCSADTVSLPRNIEELRYSLYRADFDPETGILGPGAEIIWDAGEHNASVCHPKASPDGNWIMYTVADYGTFPIWHRECDLQLMNLGDGTVNSLEAVNSDVSDTYHSWSSNSRWFVFASKREDGQYGKPFLCHIDENGKASKPFAVPQKDPYHYERTLKSYNIPDLGRAPAPYDYKQIGLFREHADTEIFR